VEIGVEWGRKALAMGKEKEKAPYFPYEITWQDEMKKWGKALPGKKHERRHQ
jgi:hypothetical protein